MSIHLSEISNIQFGLLSDEDRIKLADGRIITRITGQGRKKWSENSLYDSKMGTIHGDKCTTCKLSTSGDPGHPGIIELPIDVFNPEFMQIILKILKITCFQCGGNLLQMFKHEIMIYPPYLRLKICLDKVKKKSIQKCGKCEFENIGKYKIKNMFDIQYTHKKTKNLIEPNIVKAKFQKLTDDDILIFGFNPNVSRPENLIMKNIFVVPPTIRPIIFPSGSQSKQSEDNLFKIYKDVILAKNDILKFDTQKNKLKMSKKDPNAFENNKKNYHDRLKVIINSLITNKASNNNSYMIMSRNRMGVLKSLKGILEKKEGLFRSAAQGKRTNQSARTNIVGESDLPIDYVGIPMRICKNLSIPVIINPNNLDSVKKWITNGPTIWPGAHHLMISNSTGRIVKTFIPPNDGKKSRPAEIRKIFKAIKTGDTIHRHLIDNDSIMMNRQPTLHKSSYMGHKVKVSKDGSDTFKINTCSVGPYNADFDGDEMNMHVPQYIPAMTECNYIMTVKNHIINDVNSSTAIGIMQDSILGLYFMTLRPYTKLTFVEFFDVVMKSDFVNDEYIARVESPTSIDCLNAIFPSNLIINEFRIFFHHGFIC